MLEYCPLASGSKGNCLLVRTPSTSILIDCGLSLRTLQQRLSTFNVKIDDIDAIFITHEHTDHIAGLRSFLRQRDIPVICNRETAVAMGQIFRENVACHLFTTCEAFDWHDLHCMPFSISHDAMDPVGFRLSWQDQHLGICTDLGFVPATVPPFLTNCHLLYIEANHDPELVHQSKRPAVYKQRVLSRMGHLSNEDCGNLLSQIWHPELRHVYLAHLSQDCNRPELALSTVRQILTKKQPESVATPVDIAQQNAAGYMVNALGSFIPLSKTDSVLVQNSQEPVQMALEI